MTDSGNPIDVTRLRLGTAQLGMRYGIAGRSVAPDRQHAFTMLTAARDHGIRWLDTAPGYGHAEAWIGDYLTDHPDSFRLSGKLAALPPGLSPSRLGDHVETALDSSLARLRVKHIDQLLLHAAEDLTTAGDALAAALDREVRRGRIGRLGVSAYSPDAAAALLDYPVFSVLQHPLNLLDQRLPEHRVFARLREREIEIEARSILLQGLLTLAPDAGATTRLGASAVLQELAKQLAICGRSPIDAALPFVFATGADSALIGADTPEQLRMLINTLNQPVSAKLIAAVSAIETPESVIDPRCWPPA